MLDDNPYAHNAPSRWVSRQTHFQISRSHVLPVLFKSRALPVPPSQPPQNPPAAFPSTEVDIVDAIPLIKDWILSHLDRIYRQTPANLKPGTLETPHVLNNQSSQFTVWLEPTPPALSLLAPTLSTLNNNTAPRSNPSASPTPLDRPIRFDSFRTTPQTLHITAELTPETNKWIAHAKRKFLTQYLDPHVLFEPCLIFGKKRAREMITIRIGNTLIHPISKHVSNYHPSQSNSYRVSFVIATSPQLSFTPARKNTKLGDESPSTADASASTDMDASPGT